MAPRITFTPELETKIKSLIDQGLFNKQIEDQYGIPATWVKKYKALHNIQNNYYKQFDTIYDPEKDIITKVQLEECIKERLSIDQAAEKLGVSRTVVTTRQKAWGLSFSKAKFDPERYKKLKSQGLRDKGIATKMGITPHGLNERKKELGFEIEKRNWDVVGKEELEDLYLKQCLPIADICKKIKKATSAVYKYLDEYKIILRREDGINIKKEELNEFIDQNKNFEEIAKIKNTTPTAVKKALIRYDLDKDIILKDDKGGILNKFTDLQKQLLYGGLLGDSHMSFHNQNCRIKFEHCLKQKEYVKQKYKIMENFCTEIITQESRFDDRTERYNTSVCFRTRTIRIFSDLYNLFYKLTGEKYINIEILNSLTAQGLAFWYMDDGTKTTERELTLCTECFSLEDLQVILDYFKNKWDLLASISLRKRITFKDLDAILFQKIIRPYITEEFTYKLINDVAYQRIIKDIKLKEDLDKLSFDPSTTLVKEYILSKEPFTKEIDNFIKEYEWLGNSGSIPKWAFTARYAEKLAGVVLINEPNAYSKLLGEETKKYEVLIQRGASASWSPKNLGSRLISFACRWMIKNTDKRLFIAYSDQTACEIGTIYQACNWDFLGFYFGGKYLYKNIAFREGMFSKQSLYRTSTLKKWIKEKGIQFDNSWLKSNGFKDLTKLPEELKREWYAWAKKIIEESEKIKVPPKGKYSLVLGRNKREQKFLNSLKTYIPQPYPKRKGIENV